MFSKFGVTESNSSFQIIELVKRCCGILYVMGLLFYFLFMLYGGFLYFAKSFLSSICAIG